MSHSILTHKDHQVVFEQASQAELEELIAQYPYCQNLYFALLEKAYQNDIQIDPNLLSKVSTHATDRTFLFEKVQSLKSDALSLENKGEEANFELREIETLEKTLHSTEEAEEATGPMPTPSNEKYGEWAYDDPPKPPIEQEKINELLESAAYFEEEEGPSSFIEYISPDRLLPEEDDESGQSMLEKIIDLSQPQTTSFEWDANTIDTLSTIQEVLDQGKFNQSSETNPGGGPKTDSPTPERIIHPSAQQKVIKLKKPFSKKTKIVSAKEKGQISNATPVPNTEQEDFVNEIAQKSVMENSEIASETLAELLTAQEQYDKALEMYERLILNFPEKSSFFAEKIQYLKKIIAQ